MAPTSRPRRGELGRASPTPTDGRRGRRGDRARVDARLLGHGDDDGDPPVLGRADEPDAVDAGLAAHRQGELAQRPRVDAVVPGDDAARTAPAASSRLAGERLRLQPPQLLGQRALPLEEPLDRPDEFVGRGVERGGGLRGDRREPADLRVRAGARRRLDAAGVFAPIELSETMRNGRSCREP